MAATDHPTTMLPARERTVTSRSNSAWSGSALNFLQQDQPIAASESEPAPAAPHPAPVAPIESGLLSSIMATMGLALAPIQHAFTALDYHASDFAMTKAFGLTLVLVASIVSWMSFAYLVRRGGSTRAARGSTVSTFTFATSLLMSYVSPLERLEHSSFLVVSDTNRGSL